MAQKLFTPYGWTHRKKKSFRNGSNDGKWRWLDERQTKLWVTPATTYLQPTY